MTKMLQCSAIILHRCISQGSDFTQFSTAEPAECSCIKRPLKISAKNHKADWFDSIFSINMLDHATRKFIKNIFTADR